MPLRFRCRVARPSSGAKCVPGQKREKPNERRGWLQALLRSTTRSVSASSEGCSERAERSLEQSKVRSRETVLMMRTVASSRGDQGEATTTLDRGRQISARTASRGSLSTPARVLFRFQSVCSGNLKLGVPWRAPSLVGDGSPRSRCRLVESHQPGKEVSAE